MVKVNNKDTRKTSLAYFTPWSSVSIVKQVNAGWNLEFNFIMLISIMLIGNYINIYSKIIKLIKLKIKFLSEM